MITEIGVGFSQNADIEKAAEEAAFRAKNNIKEAKIDFALTLSTIHYTPEKTTPIIYEILNKTKLVGSSTAGIILSDSVETRGILVLAISSEEIMFGIGSVNNINQQDMHKAGILLARNSVTDFGPHGRQIFLFFVDSLLKNNSVLLKGIQEVLGNVFPIIGAGSCDDFHFKETYQIFKNRVLHNSASGLIIGGHMNVGVGVRHGWRPLGKPRIIDEADGNIIRTIDGQPAATVYEEYFGEEVESLRSAQFDQIGILYPLGIYMEGTKQYLLRNAVDIRPNGNIVCQGEVPRGNAVHIMIGNKDSCKQAAFEAAQEAQRNLLGKKAKLVIVIDSMARLKLFGRMAYEEIKKIKEVFGLAVPIVGMYANGEISPFQTVEKIKKPHLQNESIVILAIS